MQKERKISPLVRKLTFAEAELADDEYWANATAEERLQELIELRSMFFGDADKRIKKVVSKRNRYEEKAWQNKKIASFENVPVNFIGYNDLIIAKQKAGRPQDIADVDKLTKRNKKRK